MATPVAASVPRTGDARVDALIQGSSWNVDGTRVVTFAIHDLGYSEAQTRNAVADAFSTWAAVADLRFEQVFAGVDPSAPESSPADIAVVLTGNALQHALDALGLACPPDPAFADDYFLRLWTTLGGLPVTRTEYPHPEGDVYLDDLVPTPFVAGSGSYRTIVHEIGHALGLSHPDNDAFNPAYTESSTIMSGNPIPGALPGSGNPASPMPNDILAIQHIYGANLAYRTGDDRYILTDDGIVRTVWDAGGWDTFDASALPGGLTIDLRPGAATRHGSRGSITVVAFNVDIENAYGTADADTIIGTDAANTLDGRGGADLLRGGRGGDVYLVDQTGDTVVENAGEGWDTVRSTVTTVLPDHVESLVLEGMHIDGTGNALANTIVGSAGRNVLVGLAGDDTLDGAAGIDTVVYAGSRSDYAVSRGAAGLRITDLAGPSGIDLVSNVERFRLADMNIAVDMAPGQSAAGTVRLLGAAWGAAAVERPDYVGIGLVFFDGGWTLRDVAQFVITTPAFRAANGATTETLVRGVYFNITGSEPTESQVAYYAGLVDGPHATLTQADLLIMAAESEANAQRVGLAGLQETGINYV